MIASTDSFIAMGTSSETSRRSTGYIAVRICLRFSFSSNVTCRQRDGTALYERFQQARKRIYATLRLETLHDDYSSFSRIRGTALQVAMPCRLSGPILSQR